MDSGIAWSMYCPRCGRDPDDIRCVHAIKGVVMTADEASRVRARYELGRVHNPDHDQTSYRDQPNDQPNQDRPGEPRP